MQAESVYARDSLSGAARIFGSALTTGLSIEDVEQWPARVGAIGLDQVNAAGREVLQIGRSVTGLLMAPSSADEGQTG